MASVEELLSKWAVQRLLVDMLFLFLFIDALEIQHSVNSLNL